MGKKKEVKKTDLSSVDLQKVINKSFERVITEQLEDKLNKAADKAIDEAIKEALGWGSDAKKMLKDKIESLLKISFENLVLEDYANIVTEIIKKQVGGLVAERVSEPLKNGVFKELTVLEKTDWKLSEIIEKITNAITEAKEQSNEYGEDGELELRIDYEDNNKWVDIYIKSDEEINYDKIDYRICLYNNRIVRLTIRGKDYAPDSINEIGSGRWDIEIFLASLFINGAKISVDENECNECWSTLLD